MKTIGLALSCLLVPALLAQPPVTQLIADLSSRSPSVRMKAVRELRNAPNPQAAVPLAALVTDERDEIQMEAIAAEVNTFLAEKVVARRHVAVVVEVRNAVGAEAAFAQGPLALGPLPVPAEVIAALQATSHDGTPRTAVEALYALGTLAVAEGGHARRDMLMRIGPELAGMLGVADPAIRFGACRVLGRVFARRPQDDPIDQTVGDAVIASLNDDDRNVRGAAMRALGAMRYDRALQSLSDQFQYFARSQGGRELAAAAMEALARIGHASSLPLFDAQLASRDEDLKRLAIEGLARIGDPGGMARIQASVAGDRRDSVELAGAFAATQLASGAPDPIVSALKRPKVAAQTLQYLIEIAPGRMAVLARFAQDADGQIRSAMADALGLTDDPAVLPVVEVLVQDRDPRVAVAAERAAARLRRDESS